MARILIMEDDPDQLLLLTAALRKFGYDVTGAKTATDAIESLQASKIDLLITDIFVRNSREILPDGGISLIGFVRADKKRFKNLPIIVISGAEQIRQGPDLVELTRGIGADYYLKKPIDLVALKDLVSRLLDDV